MISQQDLSKAIERTTKGGFTYRDIASASEVGVATIHRAHKGTTANSIEVYNKILGGIAKLTKKRKPARKPAAQKEVRSEDT